MFTRPDAHAPGPTATADAAAALQRICVRPPYFALSGLERAGRFLATTARAEAPAYLERGPMTAAEVGRHAAIAGLLHAALEQRDDARRFYLARQASCRYVPNTAPFGAPVRLRTEVLDLDRRSAHVRAEASTAHGPLAQVELRYAVLTEAAFERLFRHRAQPTPAAASPYARLLAEGYEHQGDAVVQTVPAIPVATCTGHFDGFPAMPVAVLMGQLAYLAGRLYDDERGEPRPFRVERGEIAADDLAWAGEGARFVAIPDGADAEGRRFRCHVEVGDRTVAAMTLWLTDAA
ncbi:MAG: hypothetical protein P1P87_02510 [Trueperaceae bacterium]|nr:hypothetical protein [Trueperaceae bacterium]